MSECVVRMEMPSCCHDCPFEADQWDYPMCRVTGWPEGYWFDSRNNRMADCPIICQLPEGHGRLVDADELADDMKARKAFFGRKSDPQCLVKDAHTIVQAERSET